MFDKAPVQNGERNVAKQKISFPFRATISLINHPRLALQCDHSFSKIYQKEHIGIKINMKALTYFAAKRQAPQDWVAGNISAGMI